MINSIMHEYCTLSQQAIAVQVASLILQCVHQETMRGSEIVEEYGEQEVSAECEIQKPGQKECEEGLNLPVHWKAEPTGVSE